MKNTTKSLKTHPQNLVLLSGPDAAQVSIPTERKSSSELVGRCSFLLIAALSDEHISSDTWALAMSKARHMAERTELQDADAGFAQLATAIGDVRDNSYHKEFIG